MTALPPHLLASIDRINAALEVALAQPPPATGTLRVCEATEEEWNAFADVDGQVMHPNFLEWFEDPGEIHIVEFEPRRMRDIDVSFVVSSPNGISRDGSSATLLPRIRRADERVQTSVMDHTERRQAQCFLQAFPSLAISGQSRLKLASLSLGEWHKGNSTARRYWCGLSCQEWSMRCASSSIPTLRMPSTSSTMLEYVLLCN